MSSENQDFVLKISDLSIQFKTEDNLVDAVVDLSYNLERGKTLGIVGESGSGKSVSSLSIMRLLPENNAQISGEILLCGESSCVDLLRLDASEMPQYRGKRIGMIFQEPMSSLNPSMKCGAQVDEAILLHDTKDELKAKQRSLELFKKVKLNDPERIYNSYPHELSGGQIQRVMISMAISCKPEILIADEPTTALDVTVQKEVIQLLKDIQEESNMSMIFISHDLGVIKQIAQDVLVMRNGIGVEYGSVDKVFNNPVDPYTKGLIACRPPLNYKMDRLPTILDFIDNEALTADIFKAKHLISKAEKNSNTNILEVNNLSTWYVKRRNLFGKATEYVKALNDVSFSVKKGECLGLVGESGSGKSTLSKTIMMLVKSKAGTINFEGENILNYSDKKLRNLRKDLQIIFQDPYSSLNPRLTVGYAIMEPLLVHNMYPSKVEAKARVLELLELVGLEASHFDRYPHEFSGGQRQRIVIARSLGLNPKFVICDECVSALDVSVQAQIVNLLLELKEKLDLSYIFISHDLAVVQFISDRILVMKDGRIVERGESEDIIKNPQEDYTKALLAAVPK